MKPLLILCLGNDIVSDDGFGPVVARKLLNNNDCAAEVEVVTASLAGFNLLDLLAGREKALIVDSMVSGRFAPGTLNFFPAGVLTPAKNLITSHQISLPTSLELGKILGLKMPKVVDVIAVEAEDIVTLNENLTPTVQKAVNGALELIYKWISHNCIKKERV